MIYLQGKFNDAGNVITQNYIICTISRLKLCVNKELLYKIFVAFLIDGKVLLSQKRCTLIMKNKPLNYIALLLGQFFFFQVSITGHSRQLSRNKFVDLELIANLEKNDFNFSETRDSLSVNALLN